MESGRHGTITATIRYTGSLDRGRVRQVLRQLGDAAPDVPNPAFTETVNNTLRQQGFDCIQTEVQWGGEADSVQLEPVAQP